MKFEELMQEHFDDGREEGIRIGRGEGRTERTLEIAAAMRLTGISLEAIAKCTGLTAEEIAALPA